MVASVVALVAAAHHTQRRGHGALTRRQDRAQQQQLGFLPGRVGEQHCEGQENGYNGIGQGEHGWTFSQIWVRPAYPAFLLFLNFAKSPDWVLDVSFREDESRVRTGNAPENLALVRHMALNLLRQDQTRKASIKAKRKLAGWDNNYLLSILSH